MDPARPDPRPILVVEDDPAIRRLLVALLTSAGYQVNAAADGEQALALLAESRPDAVFLDITLPQVSGWEILAHLRAGDTPPPVVLLTADATATRRAHAEGATAAILKPFDIDEVLDVAGQILGPPTAAE